MGESRKRARLVSGALLALLMALAGRLVDLQVLQREQLSRRAESQYYRRVSVPAPRGRILDRLGRALALSERGYDLCFYPNQGEDPRRVAVDVSRALGLPLSEIEERFLPLSGHPYHKRYIARSLSAEEAAAVNRLGHEWLRLEPRLLRVYPFGAAAGEVVGFVGMDGRGLAGAELAFDEELAGREGSYVAVKDGRGREVALAGTAAEPMPGRDVRLTIDLAVQRILEKELAEACERWCAAGGAAVALEPWTGEVLGLASWPEFDPNHPTASPSAARNRAVGFVYEPGSTFKVVPAAAVLEEGIYRLSDVIDCGWGRFTYLSHTITDVHGYDALSVEDAIVHSSNVAAAKMGLALGPERLYRYARAFGFGARTECGLPSEESGILRPPGMWSKLSPAVVPYGYEVAVTPIQMARAVCAVATGGLLPELTIRAGEPPSARRVISPETAALLAGALRGVVERGTGRAAAVPRYCTAGKTGTARKAGPGGYTDTYVSSFVGFAPADDPRVVVAVVIDEPKGSYYGGTVAAPVFSRIVAQLMAYMRIPPEGQAEEALLARGDVAGEPLPPAREETAVGAPRGIVLLPGDGPCEGAAAAPSLLGLPARDAVAVAGSLGLVVRLEGAGLVCAQDPAPGELVRPGQLMELSCDAGVGPVALARGVR